MLLATVVVAILAALAGASGWWALRSRAEADRLRRRLDGAAHELQRLQTAFGRFAPEVVVERIASGGGTVAARRQVTVLFADLVGFTSLSEGLDPEALVEILNAYFGRMSAVIANHRGHVSKFIGDGLMALFGALEPNPWQANDAVHAALAMRAALAEYNAELRLAGRPQLRFGIGIHSGPAVAGIVGSRELVEFTVIGHTVNVASRVERLTRAHGVDIAVSAAACDGLDPRFALRALPPTRVAGIAESVEAFAVEGLRDAPAEADAKRS